ncbi:unnamed protein product [Cylicocyclus nassatus]|uniref:Uncharacterized protein n=1 Tax=Cylicocyclus nassatus TaxID=53992 RepID=A0AA36MAS5_CYLNA|nr:unnamed protein product [Cylicocyclus nassatus]
MYQKYPVPQNHNNSASRFKKYGKSATSVNSCSPEFSLGTQQSTLGLQPKTNRIGTMMKWMGVLFFLLLICGSAITTVITLLKTPESKTFNGTVITFAMFSGDKKTKTLTFPEVINNGPDCSLEMNKNNSRKAIKAMEEMNYRYNFILYGTAANTSSPESANAALKQLESIKPNSEKQCNLTSVIAEFKRLRNGTQNCLIYNLPCQYQYDRDDPVRKMFVQELSKVKQRVMLVSLTANASKVKETFELGDSFNIVGMEETDLSSKIASFCASVSLQVHVLSKCCGEQQYFANISTKKALYF